MQLWGYAHYDDHVTYIEASDGQVMTKPISAILAYASTKLVEGPVL